MHLVLDDGTAFAFQLYPITLETIVTRWITHLRHVDIPWRPWEYLPRTNELDRSIWIERLIQIAKTVGVDADGPFDQQHLNSLHEIYEHGYNGDQTWTDFHEHIHVLESKQYHPPRRSILEINYRQVAGPLKQKFNNDWFDAGRTHVMAGEIYLAWEELGKTPYNYWRDREPDELSRMCELAKPWLWLRPKFHISFEDINFIIDPNPGFQSWYQKYKIAWCQHHGIRDWTIKDMCTVIPIAKISDYQQLETCIKAGQSPKRFKI